MNKSSRSIGIAGARLVLNAFAIALVFLWAATAPAAVADSPAAIAFTADQPVTARDGTRLSLRIWRPDASGCYPTVFQHTPYLSDEAQERARRFVESGFALASLERRGRGMSDGEYRPLEDTGPDAVDAVNWIAAQPWSDGRIVTRGGSYRGMTQWQLLAEHPTVVKAAIPTASVFPGWDYPNPRGMFLAYAARWLAFVEGRARNSGIFGDATFWHRQYLAAWRGERAFAALADNAGIPGDTFERWFAEQGYSDFWRRLNPTAEQYAGMTQPVLSITGYFDADQEGALRYYDEHLQHAEPSVADRHWLLIGPWDHGGTRQPSTTVAGLKFDPAAVVDIDQLHIDWYRHVLDDDPRPELLGDRVTFYVIGLEQWQSEPSLEAVSDSEWVLYLDPAGRPADHLYRAGQLAAAPPSSPKTTQYRHAPSERLLADDWASDWEDPNLYARHKHAFQPNQLFFHSAPIEDEITVCGVPRFEAYVQSNVPDTDVQVSFFEISASNEVRWLGSDLLRGRFRNGVEQAEPIPTDRVEPWRFERFWWTCRRLEAGSHVRLVIGPADTPDHDRNDHRGNAIASGDPATWPTAELTLHHSTDHPTRLVLPVRAQGDG